MSTHWAVVTGASSGLGVAYAERLAGEGAGVVLVARSTDKLEAVAADLRERFGVETRVLPTDLTDHEARARLIREIEGLEISHLVNNAGFGTLGSFHELSPERITQEVELDVVALTELTRAVVPGMRERGSGAIINVGSTASFQPIPEMAVYAAAKAYVLRFTVALWGELKGTGVRAVCICPGPTQTDFFANAGNDSVMARRRTPQQVIDTTFDALARHRPVAVDGARNAVMAFANRLVPVGVSARIAQWIATH